MTSAPTITTPAPAPQPSLQDRINSLLGNVPDAQRQAAADLLAQYGPRFFDMAREDAWGYLRRILAGDFDAVAELDTTLSNDAFIARVKANTARWENVAQYNIVRNNLKNEFLLRLAPIVAAILGALVGL